MSTRGSTVLFLVLFCDSLSANNCSKQTLPCKDGLLIPLWRPAFDIGIYDRILRSVVYLLSMLYLFLGVSMAADRFMAAIEVITSQERNVSVRRPDGSKLTVKVRVWNDTVSNLTLMALGSSAPEILLSVIEICGNRFEAGELGPNTIVGSAAFNLFMIIAICIYAVPSTEVRRQQHLDVFMVTAVWSIFAYIWLYLIIAVFSPGEVQVWEGVVTFLFFPITVLTAYVVDKKMIQKKFKNVRYRANQFGLHAMTQSQVYKNAEKSSALLPQGNLTSEERTFEEQRREFLKILTQLRKDCRDADMETLEKMAAFQMIHKCKKSRAFYRVQVIRKLTGSGDVVKSHLLKQMNQKKTSEKRSVNSNDHCVVYFKPCHYNVMENIGSFNLTVVREGGLPDITVAFDYFTKDGTAKAESDYKSANGTVTMGPGQTTATIPITIIDDDVFEEDEHFFVYLSNQLLLLMNRNNRVSTPRRH
ncbi:unnamed protein product [Soboliphyme baturini]|uniref:Calx-beta domain-containing protein n=1 Tax=Soboliphyme baturini TaxID=241478 RepID=A0A183IK57_9BILA|nr:unnamed protein product [Soboliphyme baturini]